MADSKDLDWGKLVDALSGIVERHPEYFDELPEGGEEAKSFISSLAGHSRDVLNEGLLDEDIPDEAAYDGKSTADLPDDVREETLAEQEGKLSDTGDGPDAGDLSDFWDDGEGEEEEPPEEEDTLSDEDKKDKKDGSESCVSDEEMKDKVLSDRRMKRLARSMVRQYGERHKNSVQPSSGIISACKEGF